MRRILVALLVFAMALAASPASAAPRRLQVAVRAGGGIPAGSLSREDGRLATFARRERAAWFDLGWRLTPNLSAGIYLQLSLLSPVNCRAPAPCAGHTQRAGLAVAWHFRPRARLDPWAGAGFGYTQFHTSRFDGQYDDDLYVRGIEWLHLQGGLDWRVLPQVAIGPYAAVRTGEFLYRKKRRFPSETPYESIPGALHHWVQGGFKLTWNPL